MAVPVLSLIDELTEQGFSAKDCLVPHEGPVKEYDGRNPTTKRRYFQAVLAIDDIFRGWSGAFEIKFDGSILRVLAQRARESRFQLVRAAM